MENLKKNAKKEYIRENISEFVACIHKLKPMDYNGEYNEVLSNVLDLLLENGDETLELFTIYCLAVKGFPKVSTIHSLVDSRSFNSLIFFSLEPSINEILNYAGEQLNSSELFVLLEQLSFFKSNLKVFDRILDAEKIASSQMIKDKLFTKDYYECLTDLCIAGIASDEFEAELLDHLIKGDCSIEAINSIVRFINSSSISDAEKEYLVTSIMNNPDKFNTFVIASLTFGDKNSILKAVRDAYYTHFKDKVAETEYQVSTDDLSMFRNVVYASTYVGSISFDLSGKLIIPNEVRENGLTGAYISDKAINGYDLLDDINAGASELDAVSKVLYADMLASKETDPHSAIKADMAYIAYAKQYVPGEEQVYSFLDKGSYKKQGLK